MNLKYFLKPIDSSLQIANLEVYMVQGHVTSWYVVRNVQIAKAFS